MGRGPDPPPKRGARCARVGGQKETWLLCWIWGAGSVMKHFPLFRRIHFSKVPLCTEPFVSTLFLLNKKGELYYCANESSRQRQILPRFLLISKSYGASEINILHRILLVSHRVQLFSLWAVVTALPWPAPGGLCTDSRTPTLSPCPTTPPSLGLNVC